MKPEQSDRLMQLVRELGWNVFCPKMSNDELNGLVIGTPAFMEEVILPELDGDLIEKLPTNVVRLRVE